MTNSSGPSGVLLFCVVLGAIAGCGGGTTTPDDTGNGGVDVGLADSGGGTDTGVDAAHATDTGVTPTDTGTTPTDTGTTPTDTGVSDTGTTPTDTGVADTGVTPHDTGVSTADGGCTAILGGIGTDCTHDDTVCATGFTCQTQPGIVFQRNCQILCADAPCPCGTNCTAHTGPGLAPWMQCDQL